MSDVNLEQQKLDTLEHIRKELVKYIVPACIGWPLMSLTVFDFRLFVPGIILSIIITPWHAHGLVRSMGLGAFIFKDFNYEVITTYSDGSKKSDGGVEAFQMNFFMGALRQVFNIFLAYALAAAKILIGCYKYITTWSKLENKSAVKKSAFPLIITGCIVFVAAPLAGIALEGIFGGGSNVSIEQTIYAPGDTIRARINTRDYITSSMGVFKEGSDRAIDYKDTGPGQKDFKFIAPNETGSYEIRFYDGFSASGGSGRVVSTASFKIE